MNAFEMNEAISDMLRPRKIEVRDEDIATVVADRVRHLSKLEATEPYGRCVLCNLALDKEDKQLYRNMHINCAGDFFDE